MKRSLTMRAAARTAPLFAFALIAAVAGLPAARAADAGAMFAQMDTDGDGRVTAREHALGVRKMFLAMDADGDGRVTATEMTAAQSTVGNKQADGLSSAQKIKVIDKNKDRALTVSEHVAGSRAMFARMDRNKDGVLDRSEYESGHATLLSKK
jgi:Ca2+-binding EF-hand superfamily protein